MDHLRLKHRAYAGGSSNRLPVVLIHGLFGCASNWHGIARRLAERRPVLVPDLRNHGDSPWDPLMDYPIMAADLAAFLDVQGLDRAHLVGHSMGGKAAMWLALTEPNRVGSLVVADIAPVVYGPRFEGLIRALLELPLTGLRDRRDADRRLSEGIASPLVRGYLLKSLEQGPEGRWRWRLNLRVLADAMDAILGFPDAGGRQFPGATLFLYGGRSSYLTGEALPQIRSLFPLARLRSVPDAGHWIYAEQPDTFAAAVDRFLKD